MLYDLLNSHFKLMILFHITFICTLYDIVLPNKYLSISVALFVLPLCPFDISAGVGAFVTRLSRQISSLFS